MPRVEEEICVGCGGCLSGYDGESSCPTGAIRIENGRARIDQDRCVECGQCSDLCALGAISK